LYTLEEPKGYNDHELDLAIRNNTEGANLCSEILTADGCSATAECQPLFDGNTDPLEFELCVPKGAGLASGKVAVPANCKQVDAKYLVGQAGKAARRVLICHHASQHKSLSFTIACSALAPHVDHHQDYLGFCD
jgi:hypothetical protein